jgi:hypothetical protein
VVYSNTSYSNATPSGSFSSNHFSAASTFANTLMCSLSPTCLQSVRGWRVHDLYSKKVSVQPTCAVVGRGSRNTKTVTRVTLQRASMTASGAKRTLDEAVRSESARNGSRTRLISPQPMALYLGNGKRWGLLRRCLRPRVTLAAEAGEGCRLQANSGWRRRCTYVMSGCS